MAKKVHSHDLSTLSLQEGSERLQIACPFFSLNHYTLSNFVPNPDVWAYIEDVINNSSVQQSNLGIRNDKDLSTISTNTNNSVNSKKNGNNGVVAMESFNNTFSSLFDFLHQHQTEDSQNTENSNSTTNTNNDTSDVNNTTGTSDENQSTEDVNSTTDTNNVTSDVINTTVTSPTSNNIAGDETEKSTSYDGSLSNLFFSLLTTVASLNGKDINISTPDDSSQETSTASTSTPLTDLLASLGETTAFLEAVYADPDMIDAMSVEFSADKQIGILGSSKVTDKIARQYVNHFDIDGIIANLSTGSSMPADTRKGLYRILRSLSVEQAMAAFEKRFNHPMVNDTSSWTVTNIQIVWGQLDVLPDQDVSDLTILSTFKAISGGGGYGPSWERSGLQPISIGMNTSLPYMSHVVRHEVGHAVHTEISSVVNSWLQNDIGFWFFRSGVNGIGQWVNELGGFPATYQNENDEEVEFGSHEQHRVLSMINTFVGGGASFSPARESVELDQSESDQHLWASMTENVRKACIESPALWYSNYQNFASGTRGRYFLNYWYERPCWMSEEAVSVVKATGDNYTAMSEKEFFANCYSEYFKDPKGYMDNSKWGGKLPDKIQKFFADHIVDRQPYTPPDDNSQASKESPPPPSGGMPGTP